LITEASATIEGEYPIISAAYVERTGTTDRAEQRAAPTPLADAIKETPPRPFPDEHPVDYGDRLRRWAAMGADEKQRAARGEAMARALEDRKKSRA
jgi:hypothetical protein